MSNLTNSEIIKRIMQTLVSKIGRRTSDSFAVVVLNRVINDLAPIYGFLRYIKINDRLYSEGIDAVSISPEVDSVESEDFFKGVNDLFKSTIRYLENNADFFFIKEIKEAIMDIDESILKEKGIDFDVMQMKYIVDKKQILNIDKSEVVEHVIVSLTGVLNRIYTETQVFKTINNSIMKLEKKYDFLKYIEITDKPDSEGFYNISALYNINNVHLAALGEAIQDILTEIGKQKEWETRESFIEGFKNELGEEYLSKIKEMGVSLSYIQNELLRLENEVVVKKALNVLIDLLSKKTSIGFAVASVDNIIKNLKETHDVLNYIKINASRYNDGNNAIDVISDINSFEPYKIAKAIRDIIKMIYVNLGEKDAEFIKNFKKQLGDEYLVEIEKIGLNLHFLEIKFK